MIRCCLRKECDWDSLDSFMVLSGLVQFRLRASLKASSSNVLTCVYYYFTLNISKLSFKEEGKLKGKNL